MDRVNNNQEKKFFVSPNYIWVLERVFITLFFVYAVLGSNNITYGNSIISYVMWPTLILGCGLGLYRLIHFKLYKTMTGVFAMFAMLVSIGVSTLVNHQYGLKDNLVFCIYWFLFFVVLYAVEAGKPFDRVKKDFEYIGLIFLVYISLGVIASLIQMEMGYGKKITVDGIVSVYDFYAGFSIGRLWGIFINPNNGAVSAAIAMVLACYFMGKTKGILIKIVPIVDIVLLLLYIALSDSRTGAVCLGITFGCYVLLKLLYKGEMKKKGKRLVHNLVSIIIAVAVVITGFFLPRETKDVYNDVAVKIAQYKEDKLNQERIENMDPENPDMEIIEVTPIVVNRGYDLSGDVSNRRLDAWKSAVEVFVSSPKVLILGASFKGFTQYALENMPDTYIVNNSYGYFSTLDNEIFNIMDAQGLLGLVTLLWLLICLFVTFVKNILKVPTEHRQLVIVLASVVFGLAASAMFCSVMFYHFSQNTVLFWVALGGLMYVLKNTGECYED